MKGGDADALIREARQLNANARHHKRAQDQHRKAAQAAREKQAQIERQCAAMGITVTYDPGEGTFHGQRTTSRPLDANR